MRRYNQISQLVDEAKQQTATKPRVVVAVGGVPGAGKLTLVAKVVAALANEGVRAALLPMDGYHYTRATLATFADPDEAARRRGAPFTFDADAFLAVVDRLQHPGDVYAPLFDHALKDPVENGVVVPKDTQIVFVEGNYVGLTDEPWCKLRVDQLWMVVEEAATVRERLIRRHVESGVCGSWEEATERCDGLDWQNAQYVMSHLRPADVEVTLGGE